MLRRIYAALKSKLLRVESDDTQDEYKERKKLIRRRSLSKKEKIKSRLFRYYCNCYSTSFFITNVLVVGFGSSAKERSSNIDNVAKVAFDQLIKFSKSRSEEGK